MVIVTGGAGFIGSAIVAGLNARGIDDVLVVDILGSDEKWKNLRNLRYVDYVEADDFFDMVMAGEADFDADAVFHLGACSSTTETNCSYLVKNNYEYSKILAGWAVDNDIRFIYASSAATYGDGSMGFSDDEDQLEDLKPLNMYGYSKHMFDLWAKQAGLLGTIAGVKYFNVFGPNEYHKGDMRSFVVKAFEQINDSGKVKLFESHRDDYEDGGQLRDFFYVKDAVELTLFLYENPDVNGIFNAGTGESRNWNDLAGAVFSAMNKTPNIEYIPMPDHLRDKYQYYTQADISKIRRAGFDGKITPLEDAVRDYVQKYLKSWSYLAGC